MGKRKFWDGVGGSRVGIDNQRQLWIYWGVMSEWGFSGGGALKVLLRVPAF